MGRAGKFKSLRIDLHQHCGYLRAMNCLTLDSRINVVKTAAMTGLAFRDENVNRTCYYSTARSADDRPIDGFLRQCLIVSYFNDRVQDTVCAGC